MFSVVLTKKTTNDLLVLWTNLSTMHGEVSVDD